MMNLEDQIKNIEAQLAANGTTFDIDTQLDTQDTEKSEKVQSLQVQGLKSCEEGSHDHTKKVPEGNDQRQDRKGKVDYDDVKDQSEDVPEGDVEDDDDQKELSEDYAEVNSDDDLFATQGSVIQNSETIDTSAVGKVDSDCEMEGVRPFSVHSSPDEETVGKDNVEDYIPSPTPPSVITESGTNPVLFSAEPEEKITKEKNHGRRRDSDVISPQTKRGKRQRSPSLRRLSDKRRKSVPSPIKPSQSPLKCTPKIVHDSPIVVESQSPRRSKRNISPHIPSPIKHARLDTQESVASRASTISPAILRPKMRASSPSRHRSSSRVQSPRAAKSRHQDSPSRHQSPRAAKSRHQNSPSRHQSPMAVESRQQKSPSGATTSRVLSSPSRHQSPRAAKSRVQSPRASALSSSYKQSPRMKAATPNRDQSTKEATQEIKFEIPPSQWVFTGSGLNKMMHMVRICQ